MSLPSGCCRDETVAQQQFSLPSANMAATISDNLLLLYNCSNSSGEAMLIDVQDDTPIATSVLLEFTSTAEILVPFLPWYTALLRPDMLMVQNNWILPDMPAMLGS